MTFDTGSLDGRDLTKQGKLASQGAPGTLLSPPQQHTSFIYGFWNQTQVLELGDPFNLTACYAVKAGFKHVTTLLPLPFKC